jgi:peptide/nickel transport system permease protein
MQIVFEKLPLTLELAVLVSASPFCCRYPESLRPSVPGSLGPSTVFLSLLTGAPVLAGAFLIIVFAVQFKWLPTSGIDTPAHIILPTITMALPALARLVMIVRSSMIDELNQQYVKTCFAKGLPFYRVVGVHALRNASCPSSPCAAGN